MVSGMFSRSFKPGLLSRSAPREELLPNFGTVILTQVQNNLGMKYAKATDTMNRELRTAGNMIHAPRNPFTKSRRERMDIENEVRTGQLERSVREETRKDAYKASQETELLFNNLPVNKRVPKTLGQVNNGEKKRTGFELDDSEDEEVENGFIDRQAQLASRLQTLGKVAHGMNARVEEQNGLLDRLGEKVSWLDLDFGWFDMMTDIIAERFGGRPCK